MLTKIVVHLYSQAKPLVYTNVVNAYVKTGLYCVMLSDNVVHKFPMQHIFRVIEES